MDHRPYIRLYRDHGTISRHMSVGLSHMSAVLKPVKLVSGFWIKCGFWCHVFMLFLSPETSNRLMKAEMVARKSTCQEISCFNLHSQTLIFCHKSLPSSLLWNIFSQPSFTADMGLYSTYKMALWTPKRHIYDVHIEDGWGWWGLVFCFMFADSTVFKQ